MGKLGPRDLLLVLALWLPFALVACGPGAPGTGEAPAATGLPAGSGSLSPDDLAAFDFVIEKKIEVTPLAGLSLAIRSGSESVYVKGYGYADSAISLPATGDTVYQIASLTKQFTAAAIMQLVEQEKVALHDPVQTYFPQAPDSWQGITIQHLLNHTSGLPDIQELPRGAAGAGQADPNPADDLIAALRDTPLEFEPGSRFKYGNSSYLLLAGIIQQASGLDTEAYFQQHLLDPLELDSTFACHGRLADVAQGHQIIDGALVPVLVHDPSAIVGTSGLCSTAGDLIRWQQALSGGRVVSPDSYRQMIAPTTLVDGSPVSYGYALGLGDDSVAHGGAVPGFRSWMIHYPEADLTLVVLANTDVPVNASLDTLAQVIAGRILGHSEQ